MKPRLEIRSSRKVELEMDFQQSVAGSEWKFGKYLAPLRHGPVLLLSIRVGVLAASIVWPAAGAASLKVIEGGATGSPAR
jgi:hypothetical protein